jgi:hypothetical protein
VALTWFFLAKVAAFDELFTSGVIRIDDPDAIIFNFLDACEGVYERYSPFPSRSLAFALCSCPFLIIFSPSDHVCRRSTHYPERLDETFLLNPGAQRGLDIRKDEPLLRLPANKHTLLFFRYPSTCLPASLPPFLHFFLPLPLPLYYSYFTG